MENPSNFYKYINLIEVKGKELFGKHFNIHEEDHELIFKLLVYFLKDKSNAEKHSINLNKGILLTGPVGCGKTSLMKIFRYFLPDIKRHILKPCRDVSFEFIKEGYEVIARYSKQSFKNQHPKTYCFDDLGTENNLKYYGNDCNVMAEILLSRYELFISHNLQTHITTNLNSEEIEELYGLRVRSRMRESYNLISFAKNSIDKRK